MQIIFQIHLQRITYRCDVQIFMSASYACSFRITQSIKIFIRLVELSNCYLTNLTLNEFNKNLKYHCLTSFLFKNVFSSAEN
jgi:hypothetical protein